MSFKFHDHGLSQSLMDSVRTVLEGHKEGTWKQDGKEWKTLVFKSDDEANEFMAKNKEYGVIGTKNGMVHVAKNKDMGKKKMNEEKKPKKDDEEKGDKSKVETEPADDDEKKEKAKKEPVDVDPTLDENAQLDEGKRFKKFGKEAQKVWSASNIEKKKETLRNMVNSFSSKDKAPGFLNRIKQIRNPEELDRLAANIAMADISMKKVMDHYDDFGGDFFVEFVDIQEKTLTPAEEKKREEIVKSLKKDGMEKDKAYAVATSQAKKVAEGDELYERQAGDENVENYIRKQLKKMGKDSLEDLTPEEKKELFNKVDREFRSDKETDKLGKKESVQEEVQPTKPRYMSLENSIRGVYRKYS